MPSAIIFDLDGTLLDTEPDFTLLLNQQLLQHGLDPLPAAAVRRSVSSGARAIVKLGFGLQDDDPRLPILLEEFLDMYAGQIPQTTASLFEDIDALIAVLHADGIPWGIMTNKSRRFSAPLLERFESFGSCSSLVCPDDVGVGKPDPAGILKVCRELQLPADQAIYVGDHPRDIEAARNAGMPGVAVRWGYLPQDKDIEQWGADFIASNPLHLAEYLESLHGHA